MILKQNIIRFDRSGGDVADYLIIRHISLREIFTCDEKLTYVFLQISAEKREPDCKNFRDTEFHFYG